MPSTLNMLKTNVEVQDLIDRRPVVLQETLCSWWRRETRDTHVKNTYRTREGRRKHSRGRDLQGLWFYKVLIIATFYAMVVTMSL